MQNDDDGYELSSPFQNSGEEFNPSAYSADQDEWYLWLRALDKILKPGKLYWRYG